MLAGILEEQGLEIGTAGGQDHFVRLDAVAIARQCHVHKRFTLQQLIEHICQIGLIVVPSQAELLRRAGCVLHHGHGGGMMLMMCSGSRFRLQLHTEKKTTHLAENSFRFRFR